MNLTSVIGARLEMSIELWIDPFIGEMMLIALPKTGVTVVLASIVNSSGLTVEARSPIHFMKFQPPFGVAVTCTCVPAPNVFSRTFLEWQLLSHRKHC